MTANEILDTLRRALFLDAAAYRQIRDDTRLTTATVGGMALAVLIAGIGAWLYGQTVLEGYDFSVVDTVVLGSLFTLLLFFAGMGVVYIMLILVLRIDIAPDALVRLLATGHLPYALGFFVLIPELGFAFGVASVIGVFFWTLFALRSALPAVDERRLLLAVLAGIAVWAAIIPWISGLGDEFVTGVFVYGLIA
jgi:hypothetical protein